MIEARSALLVLALSFYSNPVAILTSTTSARAVEMSDVPSQLLIDDLARAKKNVEQLSAAIEPDAEWRTWSRERQGCFGRTGQIFGCQTKHVQELKAETVGHSLEVEAIFETARQWFPGQDFEIKRDVSYDDGFHEMLAVNEAEGMGMSIDGYERVVGIKATTKCRDQ